MILPPLSPFSRTVNTLAVVGVASVAAGAAAGLLLAPKSGAELRRDLRFHAESFLDDITDFFDPLSKTNRTSRKKRGARVPFMSPEHSSRASQLMSEADDLLARLRQKKK